MGYRKFKAEGIYTGAEVLPPDTVLVTDEEGTVADRVTIRDAGDGVESFEGLLVPGFVNAHCHLELSHMKEMIPPGTGLVSFLTRVIKERGTRAEQIYEAMLQAEQELKETGTVAIGDICNTADTLPVKSKGILLYKNFIEVMGFRQDQATERFAAAKKLADAFEQEALSIIGRPGNSHSLANGQASFAKPCLTPHAPYSVSPELFTLINLSSGGEVITIHNQETDAENELYTNGTGQLFELYKNLGIDASRFKPSGRSSLQTFLPWLNRAPGIILVHNTYLRQEDISFAVDETGANIVFCICINANRYIESVNPPIDLLRQNNCTLVLGTDSYASNWQLNMLEEIKTIHQQFPHIPLPEILKWATINGARALGMSDRVGSFDPGKQPGIVLISNIRGLHVTDNSTAKRIL